jgi:hypothetical protein
MDRNSSNKRVFLTDHEIAKRAAPGGRLPVKGAANNALLAGLRSLTVRLLRLPARRSGRFDAIGRSLSRGEPLRGNERWPTNPNCLSTLCCLRGTASTSIIRPISNSKRSRPKRSGRRRASAEFWELRGGARSPSTPLALLLLLLRRLLRLLLRSPISRPCPRASNSPIRSPTVPPPSRAAADVEHTSRTMDRLA